jgi:hypothetical protein
MKTSSVVQLILDLATLGYVLSPKWKESSKGRTPQELANRSLKSCPGGNGLTTPQNSDSHTVDGVFA